MTTKNTKNLGNDPQHELLKEIEELLRRTNQIAGETFAKLLDIEGLIEAIGSELKRQSDNSG